MIRSVGSGRGPPARSAVRRRDVVPVTLPSPSTAAAPAAGADRRRRRPDVVSATLTSPSSNGVRPRGLLRLVRWRQPRRPGSRGGRGSRPVSAAAGRTGSPHGSEWSTTPLIMSGRWPRISQASVSDAAPSTTVIDPRPMTSMTWSGPTTPAVSSSTPRPSRLGFWAIRLRSRPSRFRCWKCWSTITPGSSPRPAAICAIRCLGVAPDAPKAIMWLEMALAPADVPATTAPASNRAAIASASRVPPMVELSRSWLPPVRKMPLASRTIRAACSSFAWVRVTAWSGRTPAAPSSVNTARYRSPASGPIDDAVLITAICALLPPASATNRPRMTLSRTLSSAPPMMMTVPCAMVGGVYRRRRARTRAGPGRGPSPSAATDVAVRGTDAPVHRDRSGPRARE